MAAVKAFARWMVRDGRATESPLDHLSPLNTCTDRRHDRRALSVDELSALLDSTTGGPDRLGISGPDRALLYRVALETGLRAGELRSLTRASFRLDGTEPTVMVGAAYSKRRREDTLPLRADLADELKRHLGCKAPAAPAFNMPRKDGLVQMLKRDLEHARAQWLAAAATPALRAEREGMDFLCYRDAAGRVADFHALRHSFITNLANGGVHPKTAQALARHSTITLTMDRYSHSLRGGEAAALSALPDLSRRGRDSARATGTEGADGGLSYRVAGHFRVDSTGKPVDSERSDSSGMARMAAGAESLGNPSEITKTAGDSATLSPSGRSGGTGRRDGFKIRSG